VTDLSDLRRHGFAVLDPIEPGYSVRAPTLAVLTASADEAVRDDTPYSDAEARIVVDQSDRIDLDVMEHERQSRLSRWQDQR
jgi:hypothetical protein